LGHIPNTFLKRAREPDQLKSTVARAAACSNCSAEFPTIISTPASEFFSMATRGSAGSARTRMVLLLMGLQKTAQRITSHCERIKRKICSSEKISLTFGGSRLTLQFAASYNTALCDEHQQLTEGLQSSTF
jgi:hypothetical protein